MHKFNIGKLLIFCLLTTFIFKPVLAQSDFEIEGYILNSKNEAVEGVSVSVEGMSDKQSITGPEGYFELSTGDSAVWLLIAPLDRYKNKRIFIPSGYSEKLTIYLTDQDLQSGDDEILNIVDRSKRKSLVSPVYTLEDFQSDQLPYLTIDQFLQGRVPGLFFSNHSGMPGGGGTLFLRGVNSINTNNSPLIVVDGLPLENPNIYTSLIEGNLYNPLTSIDPQDISNITILNGGTGSAFFGIKGSNGAILIETLKPNDIQTSIDFSFKTGLRTSDHELPQLNSKQYKALANEVLTTSNLYNENFDEEYPGLFLTPGEEDYIRYSHDNNWQNEVFTNTFGLSLLS